MRKYKINFAEVNGYSSEEFLTVLECVCRYANFSEYPSSDDILSILGIIPMDEKEAEPLTEDDVEEILFGKKEEDD